MIRKIFFSFSPLLVFTIVGKSMEPTFSHNEKVLAWKFSIYRKNDVAIIKDPRNGRILLKRIVDIKNNELFVEGDNKKGSTDSRHFGWIPQKNIIAKVMYPRR